MLAVSPVLHGKGVGGLILAYAEQKMIEAGKTKSGCQVASPIPRLIEYYQKLGYQLTGETMDWESDNLKQKCWFILMRKDLSRDS
jgi:GNAT superfamily N-acetyltransferase